MGTWVTTGTGFVSFLSDRIGYKSGLALNVQEMVDLLDKKDPITPVLNNPKEELIKVRTDHIDDAFQVILYRLGVTDRKVIGHAPTILDMEYSHDPYQRSLFRQVLKVLGEIHFDQGKISIYDGFDEGSYYDFVEQIFGKESLGIARRLVSLTKHSEEASPWDWFNARVTEWTSPIELKSLFESESLESMYGTFFDQRYINYLANNTSQLSDINWRKFEALTAEYFQRMGCVVEIGAGRNDGGIDVRVWSSSSNIADPPVQLIQCKRTKSKVDKVLVKSLWADVVNENAKGGIIVTTSSFAPGAREVCKVRNYPIHEANRETVIHWLHELRKTGKGVFMGE